MASLLVVAGAVVVLVKRLAPWSIRVSPSRTASLCRWAARSQTHWAGGPWPPAVSSCTAATSTPGRFSAVGRTAWAMVCFLLAPRCITCTDFRLHECRCALGSVMPGFGAKMTGRQRLAVDSGRFRPGIQLTRVRVVGANSPALKGRLAAAERGVTKGDTCTAMQGWAELSWEGRGRVAGHKPGESVHVRISSALTDRGSHRSLFHSPRPSPLATVLVHLL